MEREATIRYIGLGSSSFLDPIILCEDNHLLGLVKPAGMIVQGDSTGALSLLDWSKEWLKKKYKKPGGVFLGLVHRLDRPVAGVVIFAKTSKAASRLSRAFRERQATKIYRAWVAGNVPVVKKMITHYLARQGDHTVVSNNPLSGYKMASLTYQLLREESGFSLLEIHLHTGRKHQIRAQLASAGFPIVGDKRYGSATSLARGAIALIATRLEIPHPVKTNKVVLDISQRETLMQGWT